MAGLLVGGRRVKEWDSWRLIYLSGGLKIVKSSSCQRHCFSLVAVDLRDSVVSNACVCVLALGSAPFVFSSTVGAPLGPWFARFNRNTRWSLM